MNKDLWPANDSYRKDTKEFHHRGLLKLCDIPDRHNNRALTRGEWYPRKGCRVQPIAMHCAQFFSI